MFQRFSNAGRSRAFLSLVCCAPLMTVACAFDANGVPTDESASSSAAALGVPYFQATWHQGDPESLPLAPFSEYWCALTGVSGQFRGFGEEVYLWANPSSPIADWTLRGKSGEVGVTGSATCYQRSSFIGVGSSNSVSPEFVVEDYGGHCPPWPWACGVSTPAPNFITAWQGDSTTMITGMAGEFRGTSEFLEVQQATAGLSSTRVGAQTGVRDDYTRLRAHSFFVGTPGAGRPVRFIDAGGWRGPASWVGETSAGGLDGSDRRRLAKRSEAMCYLTHIEGSFASADTSVKIEADSNDDWTLVVTGTSGDRVHARARCVLLDQRDPVVLSTEITTRYE